MINLKRYLLISMFVSMLLALISCSDGGNPGISTTSGIIPTQINSLDDDSLNKGFSGSFLYQFDTGELSYSRMDLKTGRTVKYLTPDWDAHFGPENDVRYYARSPRFKKNAGHVVVAKRIFGDGTDAVLVSDKDGKTIGVNAFKRGWEVDFGAELSADGQYVAFSITSPEKVDYVSIWTINGEYISDYETHSRNLVWMSDNRLFMGGWKRAFEITNPLESGPGELIEIGTDELGRIRSWALSPDETKVAYVLRVPATEGVPESEYTSKLQLLDLNTRTDKTIAIARIKGLSGELNGLFWSYDGKFVAAFGGERAHGGLIASPPMAAIPVDHGELLYINSFDSSPPSHSREIRYLTHLVSDIPVTAWSQTRYNWVPD